MLLLDDDDFIVGRSALGIVDSFLFGKNNFFFAYGLANTTDNGTNSELFEFDGFGYIVLSSILEIDSYTFFLANVFLAHEFFF